MDAAHLLLHFSQRSKKLKEKAECSKRRRLKNKAHKEHLEHMNKRYVDTLRYVISELSKNDSNISDIIHACQCTLE